MRDFFSRGVSKRNGSAQEAQEEFTMTDKLFSDVHSGESFGSISAYVML